jgi:hypothetical protein
VVAQLHLDGENAMKLNENHPSNLPDGSGCPDFSHTFPIFEEVDWEEVICCDMHVYYLDVLDLAGQPVRLRPVGVDYWPGINQADGTLLLGVLSRGVPVPSSVVGRIERVLQIELDDGPRQIACFPTFEGWGAPDQAASTTSNASDRSVRFGTNGETVVITSTGQALIDADAQDWLHAQPGAAPVPDTSALHAAVVTHAATVGSSRSRRGASDPLRSMAIAYGVDTADIPGCRDCNDSGELRYVPCKIVSHLDGKSVLLCPMGGGSTSQLWLDPNDLVVFGCPDDELFPRHDRIGRVCESADETGLKHDLSRTVAFDIEDDMDEMSETTTETSPPTAAIRSVCTVGSDGDVQIRVSLVAAPAPA